MLLLLLLSPPWRSAVTAAHCPRLGQPPPK